MKQTKINVQKVINTIDGAFDRLEKGIPNTKISKSGKQERIGGSYCISRIYQS